MKVAFLNPIGDLGGGERSLLDLLHSLRTDLPDLRLLLISGTDGPLLEEAKKLDVETLLHPMPESLLKIGDSRLGDGLSPLGWITYGNQCLRAIADAQAYGNNLSQKIREFKPDLVHSNGIKFHALCRVIDLTNIPVLFHLRDFISSRMLARHVLRWSSARANHVVAVSNAVAKDALSNCIAAPVSVVYDAIDTENFHPTRGITADLDTMCGMSPAEPNTIRIGLVATYAKWKGHQVFLDSIAHLTRMGTDNNSRFYIIGGSIYRTAGSQFTEAELHQRATALGLNKIVGFIGFQENIASVYRSLDIVVHTSTQPEPFGRTIVEAMGSGKAVIATKDGGAAELFSDNIDAVGIVARDAMQLARKMQELIDNPSERKRLGHNARETVLAKFSRERLAADMMNLYRQLAK